MKKGELINNRYRVINQIGKGGTSEVYKVYDTHVARELAMKVLRNDNPRYSFLARGEIEMLKAIKYPLFPAIYDAFTAKGRIIIVSEYIYGQRLDEVIKSGGLSRDESLRIIGRIADALNYLHDFKPPILYLDLKPENIILNEDFLPILIDFGIACRLMGQRVCMGTYGYSPPEQYLSDSETIDERTDIYSLGMTYLAIRSGRAPDTDYNKNVNYIRKSRMLNRCEKAFLLRAVSINKSDRFSSMAEVRREIKRIRDYPKKTVKKVTIITAIASIITACTYISITSGQKAFEKNAAYSMIDDATRYMKDGEYTKEGMGIIKGFVQSGCLSKKTEQEFILEMAKNCLYIQQDYKTAAVYYSKLDDDDYPNAKDYENLCRMMSGFDEKYDKEKLIGIYYNDVLCMNAGEYKYADILIAADMFALYDENRLEGIKKSITVLQSAMEDMDKDVLNSSALSKEKADEYKKTMQEKIDEKERCAKEILKNKRKGGL